MVFKGEKVRDLITPKLLLSKSIENRCRRELTEAVKQLSDKQVVTQRDFILDLTRDLMPKFERFRRLEQEAPLPREPLGGQNETGQYILFRKATKTRSSLMQISKIG